MASEVKTNKVSPATGSATEVTGLITSTSDARGDVLYHDGTNFTRLAKPGTPAGEVLTFATSATAPSWVAAAAGGFDDLVSFTSTQSTPASNPAVMRFFLDSQFPVSALSQTLRFIFLTNPIFPWLSQQIPRCALFLQLHVILILDPCVGRCNDPLKLPLLLHPLPLSPSQ